MDKVVKDKPVFIIQKLESIQKQIDSKKLRSKKAKKLIYDFLKEQNRFCGIGDRNFTSQFLCDMQFRTESIEVFKGEKGEKIWTFVFDE
jgi:hypothetical protein